MEWISIKDKQPTRDLKGKEILLLVNNQCKIGGVVGNGILTLTADRIVYFIDENEWSLDFFEMPTHWMPLPEIPNGMDTSY